MSKVSGVKFRCLIQCLDMVLERLLIVVFPLDSRFKIRTSTIFCSSALSKGRTLINMDVWPNRGIVTNTRLLVSVHVFAIPLSQADEQALNTAMVQTNVQSLCTHDYKLKDLVLISLEFVCSPTV